MSTRIFTQGKDCIRSKCLVMSVVVLVMLFGSMASGWEIDLSRRQKVLRDKDLTAAPTSMKSPGFFERLLDVGEPIQEIVILNTKSGFVPKTLRLRQGLKYQIHVVNVNENEKNVSFILDSFSQHHATYYGKTKDFFITPKKEGIFSFQCPETSEEGRMIVYASGKGRAVRQPTAKVGE